VVSAIDQRTFSGGVIAAVLAVVFHQRTKSIEQRLRVEAEERISVYRSTREWKQSVLSQVLGPSIMHFDRTRRAFGRWKDKQLFLEIEVIGTSNRFVRDLLLAHGHLIPTELLENAGALVEHYDVWLEEFDRKRGAENPDPTTEFIFVGPQGYPFPTDADRAFRERFHGLRRELYGVD
jgi:hypothetical protein